MSKERLEAIRKNTRIHVYLEKDTTAEMPREDMEYLQSRAERVHLLELRIDDLYKNIESLKSAADDYDNKINHAREAMESILDSAILSEDEAQTLLRTLEMLE